MNIKSIMLVYEDGECCKVYKKDIISISMKNIGSIAYKIDRYEKGTTLKSNNHLSDIEIVVVKNKKTEKFGRIDVTQIIIGEKDNTKHHFFVDWAKNDPDYDCSSLQSVERKDDKIIFKSVSNK